MHVLQLCKKYPFPPKDGESIAIYNLAAALQEAGATIDLLAMNTTRHQVAIKATAEWAVYEKIASLPVDNRIRLFPAFVNLFSTRSYHIERFVSRAFAKKLRTVLEQTDYDIVQLETLYLMPYLPIIRKYSRAKICLRAHNIEHEIWERIVATTPPGLKHWYLKYLTRKLRNYELGTWPEVDLLAAISERDWAKFQQLGYAGPGLAIPIGLDTQAYEPAFPGYQSPLSIGFIGSLDWLPNLTGLQWFLQDVWPAIHQAYPDLQLHIAGRNTPDWLLALQEEQVYIHGEVADARAFMQQHPIALVPLQSGSGMRVKILEAMALGKVVLTTQLGLEGIPAIDERQVLIANRPGDFLEKIHFCQIAPDRLALIGRQARAMVAEQFDSSQIGQRLLGEYEGLWSRAN